MEGIHMKKHTKTLLGIGLLALLIIALTACEANGNDTLSGSGTLSALKVSVVPEVSGKIVTINVEEGSQVKAGDVLLKIEDDVFAAQKDQADAAVAVAEATLSAAQAQLAYVKSQYELALDGARFNDLQARQNAWSQPTSEDFKPVWYYTKAEQIAAAEQALDAALEKLEERQDMLEKELEKAGARSFVSLEKQLAEAQTRLSIANITYATAQTSPDEHLKEAAEKAKDLAQSAFDNALNVYNDALSTTAAEDVLNARAEVAVAQSSYDSAQDLLMSLRTGEDSGQVQVAREAVLQAEAAIAQAEAGIQQAQAAQALAQLQSDRATIKAPIDGIVITRNVELGDIAVAGGSVMTIAEMSELDLIIYVPETWYGQLKLNQEVEIKVDSFPNEVFKGKVVKIADQAEFTPRNVQTADGRATTVYAVRIVVPNPQLRLKPGMPADVDFGK
jgi:multidrug resistance efflux pump